MSLRFIIGTICYFTISFTTLANDWVYVVTQGDSLWNISEKHLIDIDKYKEIQALNNIRQPRKMQPGTKLRIPLSWLKQNAAPVIVLSLKGTATLIRAGVSIPVTSQTTFELGDEIRVTQNSYVSLLFADGTRLLLTQASHLKFDHLSAYGTTGMVDTRVHIEKGKLQVKAAKQEGAGSRFNVKSGTAITAVRGTEFRVGQFGSTNEPSTGIEVTEGAVSVANGSQEIDVPAGYAVKVDKDISKPIQLLPAPLSPSNLYITKPTDMAVAWQQVAGADSYEIILSNLKHETLTIFNTSQTVIELPDLDDGKYIAEISAFDKNSIQGMSTTVTLEVNRYPTPPKSLTSKTTMVNSLGVLSWNAQSQRNKVKLQIAIDSKFKKLIFETTIDDTQFELESKLQAGKYFWRIALQGADGQWGPYSDIAELNIASRFIKPKLSGYINGSQVTLNFGKVMQESSQMVVEIANNERFNNAKTIKTKKDFIATPIDSSARVMFFRARLESTSTNEKGSWSESCRVKVKANLVICEI